VTKSARKTIKFGDKTKIRAITQFKVIQGNLCRYQLKADNPVCNFLLVINSNWHPISYRFGVIAAHCSNFGLCVFELSSPFGVEGLEKKRTCSSWVHWKARSGLPISVNWAFFAMCYGWGATSEYRFKDGDFVPTGAGWPKISGRRGRPINHSFSQKTRLNDICTVFWPIFLPFCHNPVVLRTDGRTNSTDGQTDSFLLTRPPCIQCIAVETGSLYCRKQTRQWNGFRLLVRQIKFKWYDIEYTVTHSTEAPLLPLSVLFEHSNQRVEL